MNEMEQKLRKLIAENIGIVEDGIDEGLVAKIIHVVDLFLEDKPKTYAIRTVSVLSIGLKTKAKHPTLTVESQNKGEKCLFRFNSKEDLKVFPLGKELRVRLEDISTHLLIEEDEKEGLT